MVVFFQNSSKIVISYCPPDSFSSKTAHTARVTQDWLQANCPDFITKDQWPPNLADLSHLNPLDYHVWGVMLEAYHKLSPKPKSVAELKQALQVIWDNLPQGPINKAVKNFTQRLNACVKAGGGHFEYSQRLTNCLLCCLNENVFCSANMLTVFRSANIV